MGIKRFLWKNNNNNKLNRKWKFFLPNWSWARQPLSSARSTLLYPLLLNAKQGSSNSRLLTSFVMTRPGFEPTTSRLWGGCSTDWANTHGIYRRCANRVSRAIDTQSLANQFKLDTIWWLLLCWASTKKKNIRHVVTQWNQVGHTLCIRWLWGLVCKGSLYRKCSVYCEIVEALKWIIQYIVTICIQSTFTISPFLPLHTIYI